MSALPGPKLTVQEYLEIDRQATVRSEYYQGRMYAMSGGSLEHSAIAADLIRQLGNALEDSPCTVGTSDTRIATGADGLYTYPDVVVYCGQPKVEDEHRDILLNPIVLIEVLSPSTEGYDRGLKFQQYRNIGSLREYALISQAEPRVELHRRGKDGIWSLYEWKGLDSVCRFESIHCELRLADIYRHVRFATLLEKPPSRRRKS